MHLVSSACAKYVPVASMPMCVRGRGRICVCVQSVAEEQKDEGLFSRTGSSASAGALYDLATAHAPAMPIVEEDGPASAVLSSPASVPTSSTLDAPAAEGLGFRRASDASPGSDPNTLVSGCAPVDLCTTETSALIRVVRMCLPLST